MLKIRCRDITGREQDFNLSQGPVFINNQYLILSNINNSNLVVANSIIRGIDGVMFEGDLVLNERLQFVGYVVYRHGFAIYIPTINRVVNMINDNSFSIMHAPRVNLTIIDKYRDPLIYKYKNIKFKISDIVFINDDYIYLADKKQKEIPMSEVRLCTGFEVGGKAIAFGDAISGSSVTLDRFQPAIEQDGKYVLLEEMYNGYNS